MIKEIEVKAIVKDKDFLISNFKEAGIIFGEPKKQEDSLFINYTGPYKEYKKGTTFLRIRKTDGKILFTLKQPQGDSTSLSKLEKEVVVNDANIVGDICVILGFHKVMDVVKFRMKAKFQDYEICLDEVEGLGTFIEVEKMSDEDDKVVYQELFSFLKRFGISKEDRVFAGYDVLLADKMGI
jgi:adenylate cyclase class 2